MSRFSGHPMQGLDEVERHSMDEKKPHSLPPSIMAKFKAKIIGEVVFYWVTVSRRLFHEKRRNPCAVVSVLPGHRLVVSTFCYPRIISYEGQPNFMKHSTFSRTNPHDSIAAKSTIITETFS